MLQQQLTDAKSQVGRFVKALREDAHVIHWLVKELKSAHRELDCMSTALAGLAANGGKLCIRLEAAIPPTALSCETSIDKKEFTFTAGKPGALN